MDNHESLHGDHDLPDVLCHDFLLLGQSHQGLRQSKPQVPQIFSMQRDHKCTLNRHLVLVYIPHFFLRGLALPGDLYLPQRSVPEVARQAKANVHVLQQKNGHPRRPNDK